MGGGAETTEMKRRLRVESNFKERKDADEGEEGEGGDAEHILKPKNKIKWH